MWERESCPEESLPSPLRKTESCQESLLFRSFPNIIHRFARNRGQEPGWGTGMLGMLAVSRVEKVRKEPANVGFSGYFLHGMAEMSERCVSYLFCRFCSFCMFLIFLLKPAYNPLCSRCLTMANNRVQQWNGKRGEACGRGEPSLNQGINPRESRNINPGEINQPGNINPEGITQPGIAGRERFNPGIAGRERFNPGMDENGRYNPGMDENGI